MARKRIGLHGKMMTRSILSLLAVSLLVSSCSSTQYASGKVGMPDEEDTRIDPSAETQRNLSQMLATVSNSDRERCERFAKSEADAIKGTVSGAEPLAGAIGGGMLGPIGAGLGAVIGILALYDKADADNKARKATYDEVLKDCILPSSIEASLGSDHPDLAQSLINLAARFNTAEKYGDAELRYRRAIAIQEKMLGPNHPDVATTLESYSRVLAKLDRQSEAEEIVGRYLAIRELHKQGLKAKNVVRPEISQQVYRALHALTDSFLKEIANKKCTVVAECVRRYVEEIQERYPASLLDEAIYHAEFQIALDADQGKITSDEALSKLLTVTTRHLLDIYFRRLRVYPDYTETDGLRKQGVEADRRSEDQRGIP